MPARAAWKGYLHVNQLAVPVRAFTACRTTPEIALNQLHRGCGQRIRQRKFCPTHGSVESVDIVSGFEYAHDQFLPLESEDLDALLPEDGKAITVSSFVDREAIDPVYYSGRSYYMVPDAPPGQRPFCVLRDGMAKLGRSALATVVIGRKELLVTLRPAYRLITMMVLEYPQRLRMAAEYEAEVTGLTTGPVEQQLISQLIEAMTDPSPDLTTFRDCYMDGLHQLIERRLGEQALATRPSSADEAPQEEQDLVAALRASLAARVDAPRPPARIPSRLQRTTHADETRKLG